MKTFIVASFAFSSLFASGFASGLVNTKCPIEGGEVAGKKTSSVTVTFCCKKCKAKFDEAPMKFVTEIAKTPKGKCPVSGEATEESVTSSFTVGTCCGDCKAEFEKDPNKHLAALK